MRAMDIEEWEEFLPHNLHHFILPATADDVPPIFEAQEVREMNLPMILRSFFTPVWNGHLEWLDTRRNTAFRFSCHILSKKNNDTPGIWTQGWLNTFAMQFVRRPLINQIRKCYLKDSKHVVLNCHGKDSDVLKKMLLSDWAGCVEVYDAIEQKLTMMLLLTSQGRPIVGLMPRQQEPFVAQLEQLINDGKQDYGLNNDLRHAPTMPAPGNMLPKVAEDKPPLIAGAGKIDGVELLQFYGYCCNE